MRTLHTLANVHHALIHISIHLISATYHACQFSLATPDTGIPALDLQVCTVLLHHSLLGVHAFELIELLQVQQPCCKQAFVLTCRTRAKSFAFQNHKFMPSSHQLTVGQVVCHMDICAIISWHIEHLKQASKALITCFGLSFVDGHSGLT